MYQFFFFQSTYKFEPIAIGITERRQLIYTKNVQTGTHCHCNLTLFKSIPWFLCLLNYRIQRGGYHLVCSVNPPLPATTTSPSLRLPAHYLGAIDPITQNQPHILCIILIDLLTSCKHIYKLRSVVSYVVVVSWCYQLRRLVVRGEQKCAQIVFILIIFRVQDYALLENQCEILSFANYILRYMYYIHLHT